MKRLILSVCVLAGGLGLMSCEKHSWEDRKNEDGEVVEQGVQRLYQGHGDHAEGEGHGGHDGHGDDAKKGE